MQNPLRSLVNFLGHPHVQTGLALGTAAAIESNQPSLMERPRTDQALVVAGSFASGYVVGSGYTQVVQRVTVAPPVVTDAVAGITSAGVRRARRAEAAHLEDLGSSRSRRHRRAHTLPAAAITMDVARRSVGAAQIEESVHSRRSLRRDSGRARCRVSSSTSATASLGMRPTDGLLPRPPNVAWTLSVGTGVALGCWSIVVMAERKAAQATASLLGRQVGGPPQPGCR